MSARAIYRDDNLPNGMKGNPLIEALDPVEDPKQNFKNMSIMPFFDHSLLSTLSVERRLLEMSSLEQLYFPPEVALSFTSEVDTILRQSYASRNPMLPEFQAKLVGVRDRVKAQCNTQLNHANKILLVGNSGMGKTRLVKVALSRLNKCITHGSYNNRPFNATQVVWLSVESPVNGSQRGLMLRLLGALDEAAGLTGTRGSYEEAHRDIPVDKLIQVFAQAAASHHLGILHVDDLQLVSGSPAAKSKTAHFVIQLANAVKCPVIFSGTPDIENIFGQDFQVMRRMCSAGRHSLDRSNEFTEQFLKILFRYQWTDSLAVGSPELWKKLSRLSKDITSVTLLMHIEAQKLALRTGANCVNINHYEKVYADKVKPMHAALQSI